MKIRSKRLIALALVMLILVLLAVVVVVALRLVQQGSPTITGLHVSGNKLVNDQGEVIIPHGVNRSGTEYMCLHGESFFDGPSDVASVDAMVSWHINIVRIPLNEDCWLGINGAPKNGSNTAYQQAIINYVHLLNQKNLMVILDLHWSAPGTTLANKQRAMTDADHSIAFWSSVASTFKQNSSVMFDLFNEPFPATWECWLEGSSGSYTAPCDKVDFAVAGMQSLVNAVRTTGAKNVLIASGLGYASYLVNWIKNEPQDPDHNIMASFHVYNFTQCSTQACMQNSLQPILSSNVPVIVAELGENDCQSGFINSTMTWLDQQKIGYLGWAWDVADCGKFPALIKSYDGTPTGFGAGMQQHFADLASHPIQTHIPDGQRFPMLANITSSSSESLRKRLLSITW